MKKETLAVVAVASLLLVGCGDTSIKQSSTGGGSNTVVTSGEDTKGTSVDNSTTEITNELPEVVEEESQSEE